MYDPPPTSGVARIMARALRSTAVVGALATVPALLGAQSVTELPADDAPLQVSATDVYSVGGIDAEDWETFGESLRLAFAPDGGLYVLDRMGFRVVAVAPDGTFRGAFGQEGEGPGEFRSPASVAVTPDGDVVVLDFSSRSFNVFGSDGSYKESVRIPVTGGTFAMGDVQMDPRGGGLYSAVGGGGMMMMSREETSGGGAPPPPVPGIPIQRYSLSGEPIETLHRAWDARGSPIAMMGGAAGRRGRGAVRIGAAGTAFAPTLHWTVTPDGGVAFIDSTTYRVKFLGPDGEISRSVERAIPPTPVTDEMQEREKERRLAELEEGGGPQMRVVVNDGSGARSLPQSEIRDMQRQQLESLAFFPELSAVRGMSIDRQGRLWIERRGDEATDPGPIDIVSFSGAYVGTIAADDIGRPVVFGPDGLAAFIETDEYDVATVVVKRLAISN